MCCRNKKQKAKWSDTDLDYVGSTDSGSAEFEVFTSEVAQGTVCLGGNNDWIGSSALASVRAPLSALCNYVVLVGPPDVDKIYPTLPPTMPSASAAAVPGVIPAAGGLAQGVIIGIVIASLCTLPGCLIVGVILIALLVVYRVSFLFFPVILFFCAHPAHSFYSLLLPPSS